MRAWPIPLRLATGAFILNSGLEKRKLETEGAEHLQSFASGAYPVVKRLPPERFGRALSTAEIAVGVVLLSPFVSSATAGVVLGGFSGSLLGLYWKTPGLHREHDPRPTHDGIPMAKDVWMAGSAAALVLGSIGRSDRQRRAMAKAKARTRARQEAAVRAAVRQASRSAHQASRSARRATSRPKEAVASAARTVRRAA
jgi:hypothetical protein